jgi:hypothetical protein
MILGHVAVIGGVLLAGDNPSAWEAATAEAEKDLQIPRQRQRSNSVTQRIRRWSESSLGKRRVMLPAEFKDLFYRIGFSSKYKTAWMWNRGSTKAMWIAKFSEEYADLGLQERFLEIGWIEMTVKLALPTTLLFLIPAFLGGMTR